MSVASWVGGEEDDAARGIVALSLLNNLYGLLHSTGCTVHLLHSEEALPDLDDSAPHSGYVRDAADILTGEIAAFIPSFHLE